MGEFTEKDIDELRKFGPVAKPRFSEEVVREICRRANLDRFTVASSSNLNPSLFIVDVFDLNDDYPTGKISFSFTKNIKVKVAWGSGMIGTEISKTFNLNDPSSFCNVADYIRSLLQKDSEGLI